MIHILLFRLGYEGNISHRMIPFIDDPQRHPRNLFSLMKGNKYTTINVRIAVFPCIPISLYVLMKGGVSDKKYIE